MRPLEIGGKGGGIYCEHNSSPTVSNNIIRENEASGDWGEGGGIYSYYNSDPTISNNTINGNSANHNGGGIYCYDSNPMINHNVISANVAYSEFGIGGGIYCGMNSNPAIVNNTISGNSASFSGGGIYCGGSPTITNTILWGNKGTEIKGGSPVITYCDIRGGWGDGEGNIDANPLFIDAYNDNYNVCSQSPCIDAGHPDSLDPDGTRSDIGLFYPEHPECFVGSVRHVSTTGSDTTGDGSPGSPFRTIQHAIDVSLHGDSVIVQNGVYVENINIYLKNILLASNFIYSGDTLDIQNTIIDGDSISTVVTFEFSDQLAAITGFTIRNGYSYHGGGMHCYNSHPTINNNIIRENEVYGFYGSGGGIYCSYSNPMIVNNTISGNSGQLAGGIYCG